MTNDESVSDISEISSVVASQKRPAQWTFQEWMSEEPIKMYYDANNEPHPLCQFPVKVGGAKNKKYRKHRLCMIKGCTKLTTFFCAQCGAICHTHKPNDIKENAFINM